ncbi:MAG: prefoldin subunit alpha [Methanomassiliicoccaceae archaeon]|jgi:prefoldin alpha subunit|nr:prefoldin subunit alpha [Methanomassiliicoccaceae archaeon]
MNDDEFRQALSVLEVYNSQLESFAQQAQIFRASLEEALRARETMKAFLNAKEGDEILVPIGATSFVTAKASGSGKAIVGIGTRISVEKDLDSAIAFMDDTVKDISEALKRTSETAAETETNARNLSLAVQQEYQRRQQ